MPVIDPHDPERDAENLIAWVREAAHELENAHRVLDNVGARRVREESGNAMTLSARIVALADVVEAARGAKWDMEDGPAFRNLDDALRVLEPRKKQSRKDFMPSEPGYRGGAF